VADVDAHIGELIAALEHNGVLAHSLVLFVADHGEEFLEHERIGHGAALYEETVHIPLALRVSGSQERVDVRQVVSLVDVAPTLLDLAGVALPPSFAGRSFRDLVSVPEGWPQRAAAAGAAAERSAFLEQDKETVRGTDNHRSALVVGTHKVIVQRDGTRQFFDLAADPAEKNGDALGAPERSRLIDLWQTVQRSAAENAAQPGVVEPGDAAKERLRALGYLE
jgi:arylsulfatase A-like enzyme